MRRIFSTVLVGLLASAVLIGTPEAVYAAQPKPPAVADIPDIPSRTAKIAASGGVGNSTQVGMIQLWQAMRNSMTNPPTGTVAPVRPPVPITQATTLSRGAAGGPLVTAFTGGFAIGQTGLQIYGQVTGNDPLEGICGSAFEGVGHFMYMGMMPDCTVPAYQPNLDQLATTRLSYNGISLQYKGLHPGSTDVSCWTGSPVAQFSNAQRLDMRSMNQQGLYLFGTNTKTGAPYQMSPYVYTRGPCGADLFENNAKPPIWIASSATGNRVAESVDTKPDPERKPSCTIDWIDGTRTSGNGTAYRESNGLPISADKLGCKSAWDAKPGAGTDVMPQRIGVESEDQTGAKTQIADQQVPEMGDQARQVWDPSLGNGRGLVLEEVVNGGSRSCNTWEGDCANWWDKTQQGTQTGNGTQEYRCTFGGQPLPLTECGPYRNTFDKPTETPQITDPATGTQNPWQTAPTSQSGGNTTNPGQSVGTPAGQCMNEWLDDFNPIDWILVPVKCALVWAFVPRQTVVDTAWGGVGGAWAGTLPGQVPTLAGNVFVAPTGAGGCTGPRINFAVGWWENAPRFDATPLNACTDPGATIAMSARIIGVVVLGYFTVLGLIRRFSSTVNAPGIGG